MLELAARRPGVRPRPLPPPGRPGGATGHLALEACRRYPNLKASVFDLPPVIASAREFLSRTPDGSKIGLPAGDFFADPLPDADLFALGRILHDWSLDKIRTLLRKICDPPPRRRRAPDRRTSPRRRQDRLCSGATPVAQHAVCTEGRSGTAEYRALLQEAGFKEARPERPARSSTRFSRQITIPPTFLALARLTGRRPIYRRST
jgi:hypothetical protein